MKLSIITINFNNLEGLKRTAESVINQTWREFEWIIVDGGSTDGSKEYIESLSLALSEREGTENPLTWWCSEPDKGVYNAMNKGIAQASGVYLNFMNSGDRFHEFTTLQQVFEGKEYDADVLYGESNYIYPTEVVHRVYPNPVTLHYFINNHHINHQSLFIRRDLQLGRQYCENNKISSDYLFLLNCQFENRSFYCLEGVTVCDYDATGISQTDSFQAWSEAHSGLERELVNRFFTSEYQLVYDTLKRRRLNKRLILLLCKVLAKIS